MPAAITCASCKRPLRVPENVLGQLVQCPLCLDEFVAQADPAAEAAARAAEAPMKRAAARPQPVTAPVQDDEELAVEEFEEAAVWVEPVAEAAPLRKPARESAPARALVFPVLVTRDPDRVLRGRMEAELTADGLHLRKPRQAPAFAAVGGPARYLGANRLVVTVEGREVELTVVKPWTSVYHLARDTASFLSGKGDFPNGRAYDVPWILFTLPSVFVALPFAACPLGMLTDGCGGAFLWCLIAAALAGAAFAVVLQPRLMPRTRLIGAGGFVGLGAAIYLLAFFLTPSYSVDASLWRTYGPPDGSFRVKVPGSPTITEQPARAFIADPDDDVTVAYTVDVKEPKVCFVVTDSPIPTAIGGLNRLPGGNVNNFQAFNLARNRLQGEHPSLGQTGSDRTVRPSNGLPYHELVFRDESIITVEVLAARIYVASDRTYTLVIVGPKVRADSADALKFFDSFQIKQPAIGGR
jgi:uncharacterized Zn finger protein (UPF0148 family)